MYIHIYIHTYIYIYTYIYVYILYVPMCVCVLAVSCLGKQIVNTTLVTACKLETHTYHFVIT